MVEQGFFGSAKWAQTLISHTQGTKTMDTKDKERTQLNINRAQAWRKIVEEAPYLKRLCSVQTVDAIDVALVRKMANLICGDLVYRNVLAIAGEKGDGPDFTL